VDVVEFNDNQVGNPEVRKGASEDTTSGLDEARWTFKCQGYGGSRLSGGRQELTALAGDDFEPLYEYYWR
jgi:hypothetical protein